MGNCAETLAKEHKITREDQDAFAASSYTRALSAIKNGKFAEEIVPVPIPQRKGDPVPFLVDEEPGRGNVAKLPTLRTAFEKNGTVTAGNASTINDGAAALVVMSSDAAKTSRGEAAGADRRVRDGLPRAGLVHDRAGGRDPEAVSRKPASRRRRWGSSRSTRRSRGWRSPPSGGCRWIPERVNVNGGAVALGHPVGCSGARILTTLLYAMADRGERYGVASLCIGGGEAVAVMVEKL